MMQIGLFLSALVAFLVAHNTNAGIASTWDSCNCSWDPWKAWSQCSRSCGGGTRYRSRSVWNYDTPECEGFEMCATRDMGSEEEECNNICYNGGTYFSRGCRCKTGWNGRCCSFEITCGNPGSIRNGQLHGHSFTYGKTVKYTCNKQYTLAEGSFSRTCRENSLWSGRRPRCAFVESCNSYPCLNGGRCLNGLDRYTCVCSSSFTGRNCERDIQPPEMNNCPTGFNIVTSNHTVHINWSAPVFHDPVGKDITVTTNYPANGWSFPWGDFTAQYVALKPSNGLKTICIFNIKVRPHVCPILNVPKHGAKVCNRWKQEYGMFCLVFCGGNYSLSPHYDHRQWFVCGASGHWIPRGTMPDCTDAIDDTMEDFKDGQYHFNLCDETNSKESIRKTFIEKFKISKYRLFCRTYDLECTEKNVEISC